MKILEALLNADVVIIGAGFFGATVAERIATELGKRVVVLDRRSHIGGNAYSERFPGSEIEVHEYGSHIFHTSNERVWKYLNQFTAFNDYRHFVAAVHRDRYFPMPINLATISAFLGRMVTPLEAREWIDQNRSAFSANNLEEHAVNLIGRPLYEAFIRDYTWKQWQTDPRELPAEIIQRLPIRLTFNSRYFGDRWEGIPADGYASIFEKMLSSVHISVFLETDFRDIRHYLDAGQLLVYTGALDAFFDYSEGTLGWRTVDLDFELLEIEDFQDTSVVNYVDRDHPFTRIHEFKHFHPERSFASDHTLIAREYSRFALKDDDPYYPIGSQVDRSLLGRYRERCRSLPNVIFGGRLGTYKYLDMHMAIASALQCFDNQVRPWILASDQKG